jgi:hypothetical protein
MSLSRTCLQTIAHKAATRFMASDLSAVEGMSMGGLNVSALLVWFTSQGETLYDPAKVLEAVTALVDAVIEEMKAAGTLETKCGSGRVVLCDSCVAGRWRRLMWMCTQTAAVARRWRTDTLSLRTSMHTSASLYALCGVVHPPHMCAGHAAPGVLRCL